MNKQGKIRCFDILWYRIFTLCYEELFDISDCCGMSKMRASLIPEGMHLHQATQMISVLHCPPFIVICSPQFLTLTLQKKICWNEPHCKCSMPLQEDLEICKCLQFWMFSICNKYVRNVTRGKNLDTLCFVPWYSPCIWLLKWIMETSHFTSAVHMQLRHPDSIIKTNNNVKFKDWEQELLA